MKNTKLFLAVLMLGLAFTLQAQDEIDMEIKRPKDIKMEALDSWKKSVFDLYDQVMEIKSKDDSDDTYDPAPELKTFTDEIVLLAGKSVLMVKEAKDAGKIKQLKSVPVIAKCKKALTHSKLYANSVLGEDAVVADIEEGKGK